MASSALTSASSVATEMRSCAACSSRRSATRSATSSFSHWLICWPSSMVSPPPERVLDGAAEHGEIDRLDEVVHRATLHAERRAGGVVDRGEHEEREVGLQLQHPGYQVDAAHPGEIHVQQHAGDLAPLEQGEGLVPGGRRRDFVALVDEILPDRAPNRLFVVHDHQRHRTVREGHTHSCRRGTGGWGPDRRLTRRTGLLRETGS